MSATKAKIIVGLSGGVDSTVSAYLLQQQGYDVEALFMKNWEEDDTDTYCAAEEDVACAQAICDQLGIKLHRVNFAAEYWDHVFEYFLEEYKNGRTPNPDVLCNKEIKFKAFLDYALTLGADAIATGHYAGVTKTENGYELLKGHDQNKDQSYFLYLLNQHQLAHAFFPLAKIEKTEVRTIAKEQNFINHERKDSTGICFIGERRFKDFLNTFLPAQPGDIETEDGKIIGTHQGLMFHTIGQRQGLGIGGRSDAGESPWYVAAKDLKRNVLIAVQDNQHPLLFANTLEADIPHWVAGNAGTLPKQCHAKIRYRQTDQACQITQLGDHLKVTFNTPQRAITPGQSIVFYEGNTCLGGARILRGYNE